MTLISILLGLALEYYTGSMDQLRNFGWFDRYSRWLELRCDQYRLWDGPAGVLLTLALPLLLLIAVSSGLGKLSIIFPFLIAVAVFIYSLGPDFNRYLDNFIAALTSNDEAQINRIIEEGGDAAAQGTTQETRVLRMVLLRAHEHIFAVIFWFIVLGMTGALLYALLLRMHEKNIDVHGAFASSVRDLHDIMMWPSARLLALGFALGGSLVDALDGWRSVSGHTLDCSEDIIYMSGLGAIQYQPEQTTEDDSFREDFASLMQGLQAMINRTLVVWLTVLGCLTIGGWLS